LLPAGTLVLVTPLVATTLLAAPLAEPSPVPVVVIDADRDLVDWTVVLIGVLSMVASAVAVILAMRANKHAQEEGNKARRLIASERQRTFDLEVLRDVADVVGQLRQPINLDDYFARRKRIRALLAVIHTDELDRVRRWARGGPELPGTRLPACPEGVVVAPLVEIPDFNVDHLAAEVLRAIEKRLREPAP
jgi:hypothetical protein